VKLQFLGANRQVTGSQTYVEADGARVLVDCGMFQERDFLGRNWEPNPLKLKKLDALLLTHAHVDHCGLTPTLPRQGFRSPIIATDATAELVDLVLRDSAKIQEEDAAYKRKRHRKEGRKGKHPVKPLYTHKDVERTLPRLRGVSYEESTEINGNASAVFHEAGHILGSSVIEVNVQNGGQPRRLIFSGDLGQRNKPIIRDPATVAEADYIILESTYGNRDHPDHGDVESQLEEVVKRTFERGGNLVIPIFAIERAQELLYHLSRLLHDGRIPRTPVFLDSPMAADVTEIFRRHRNCFDAEAWQLITSGDLPLKFPGLKMTRSVADSKSINDQTGPVIVLSTSGMCTAGRIKFHLRREIVRPESTILFVGYQARGTLGRIILEGREEIRIHGRNHPVRAEIAQIHGASGHADRTALLEWLGGFEKPPRQLFLIHGDADEAESLAAAVREQMGWEVTVPEYRQTVRVE